MGYVGIGNFGTCVSTCRGVVSTYNNGHLWVKILCRCSDMQYIFLVVTNNNESFQGDTHTFFKCNIHHTFLSSPPQPLVLMTHTAHGQTSWSTRMVNMLGQTAELNSVNTLSLRSILCMCQHACVYMNTMCTRNNTMLHANVCVCVCLCHHNRGLRARVKPQKEQNIDMHGFSRNPTLGKSSSTRTQCIQEKQHNVCSMDSAQRRNVVINVPQRCVYTYTTRTMYGLGTAEKCGHQCTSRAP